jgi:hypothetical protein
MRKKIYEALGWYGVVAILVAYFLVSFNYVSGQSFWFQLLNLTGSAAIAVDAFSNKDRPAAVLNVVYSLIAVIVITQIFLK